MRKIMILIVVVLMGFYAFCQEPNVTYFDLGEESFYQVLLESEEGNGFLTNTLYVKLSQTYEIVIPSWTNKEARIYLYFDEYTPLHYGLKSDEYGLFGLPYTDALESRIVHSQELIVRATSVDQSYTATFILSGFKEERALLIRKLIAENE